MWQGGGHWVCWDPGLDLGGQSALWSRPPHPPSLAMSLYLVTSSPHHWSWPRPCTQVSRDWPGRALKEWQAED